MNNRGKELNEKNEKKIMKQQEKTIKDNNIYMRQEKYIKRRRKENEPK